MLPLTIAGQHFELRFQGFGEELLAQLHTKYACFAAPLVSGAWQMHVRRCARPLDSQASPSPHYVVVEGSGWRIQHSLLRAMVDATRRSVNAEVYGEIPHPVENLLRFVMCEILPHHGGGLFHAAGIDALGAGILVAAPSEYGKTTLSRIFGSPLVLSDEMPAVTSDANGWWLHATPFWGDMGHGTRGGALPLKALLMLDGKGSKVAERVEAAQMFQRLLATTFCYSDSAATRTALEDVCRRMVSELPVLRFSFCITETREQILARLSKFLA